MLTTPFGKAAEVSIETFIHTLLPPLHPGINFDELLSQLATNSDTKLPVTKNNRLWGYSVKTPSQLKGRRLSTFKSLQVCAGKLAKAIHSIEPTTYFRNNEKAEWELKKRAIDSLPDAYLLKSSSSRRPVDWGCIAIPGAYHKFKTDRTSAENITKITRCMSQCINHDARRRFICGFTVEDSTMKLWYCDRAQIVCSDSFDFVTDWQIFFRFLFATLFSMPEGLGFDPSMEALDNEDNDTQYVIRVRSKSGEEDVYRTLEMLSYPDAERIIGKGTRVWKAIKLEDGEATGDPVVLKDSWVDGYREREGDIDARIRESATNDEQRSGLDKSLLTVLKHGDVYVAGLPDRTKDTPTSDTSRADLSDTENDSDRNPYQIHYRIIYKEVCVPLHSVSSLRRIYRALGDVCHGLYALHQCGWMHCDISIGNIMLFDDYSKIADLEYAERADKVKDLRHGLVGTDCFVAVEVKAGYYLFLTEKEKKPSNINITESEADRIIEDMQAKIKRGEPISMPFPRTPSTHSKQQLDHRNFCYHTLHDLESLWWVAAYFVVNRDVVCLDEDLSDETRKRLRDQRVFAWKLFWEGHERFYVMKEPRFFSNHLSSLHPSVQDIGWMLEKLREYLVSAYRSAEKDLQEGGTISATGVHREFLRYLHSIESKLQTQDILVCTLSREEKKP